MGQLTVARVKTLTEPGRYIDGGVLMLVVKPTGAQNWTLCVRIGGDRRDVGLGSAKVLTLAEARAKAAELRRDVARGIDPIAEKKKIVDPVPTFRDAASCRSLYRRLSRKGSTDGKANALIRYIGLRYSHRMSITQRVFMVLGMMLASSAFAGGPVLPPPADPLTVEVETGDADRFAALFEETGGKPSAERLQQDYLDRGSYGVQVFTPNRIVDAANLARRIAAKSSFERGSDHGHRRSKVAEAAMVMRVSATAVSCS